MTIVLIFGSLAANVRIVLLLFNLILAVLLFASIFPDSLDLRFWEKARNQARKRTFYEGGLYEIADKLLNKKPSRKTKSENKEPKEVYELRQERRTLQRQQTHYLKEFSPHSNKLKGITGLPAARPVSSFSLTHEEEDSRGSLFNDDWREPSNLLKVSEIKNSLSEDPINLPSPWANYNKLSKISEVKSESRASEDDDYPPSPLIKVREISMEYRQDKLKQREIGEQYAISPYQRNSKQI